MEVRMRTLSRVLLASATGALLVGLAGFVATAQVNGNDNRIAVTDDCLPGDPAWDPTGGCTLKRHQGDVSAAEFFALLRSPLTIPPGGALVGHPSWRNEPSHVTTALGKTIRITNTGGRGHTFTEVAEFGGGFVPVLNVGLTPAPECAPDQVVNLAPGTSIDIPTSGPGLHKFQCCIHPWMRATVRVE
jgi:plastocyanin